MLKRPLRLVFGASLLVACGDDGGSSDSAGSTTDASSTTNGGVTITTLPVTSETLDTTISASDGTADDDSSSSDAGTDTSASSTGDETSGPICGDGVIDPGEDCEGDDLDGQDCSTLDGFLTGTLACGQSCTFDTSGCIPGPALDVEFCRLQHPVLIDETQGTVVPVFGRVYVQGVTDQNQQGNDPVPALIGYVGYGPESSNPSVDDTGWTWLEAEPNPGYGETSPLFEANNDEYWLELVVPPPGVYAFALRFSGDAGQTFVHCDGDDPGNTNGYDPAEAGHMTSTR